jgi:hypothetical protein
MTIMILLNNKVKMRYPCKNILHQPEMFKFRIILMRITIDSINYLIQ